MTRPGAGGHLDAAAAMVVVGGCCVVLGGLVAAVTGPLDLSDGSWLAAYLVLVGGVAQYAMGRIRERHGEADRASWAWAQFWGWNLGNAAVIAGTLAGEPLVVDFGSAFLVLALLIALKVSGAADARTAVRSSSRLIWAFRGLLLVLIVSIPVGVLLSHLRSS